MPQVAVKVEPSDSSEDSSDEDEEEATPVVQKVHAFVHGGVLLPSVLLRVRYGGCRCHTRQY